MTASEVIAKLAHQFRFKYEIRLKRGKVAMRLIRPRFPGPFVRTNRRPYHLK